MHGHGNQRVEPGGRGVRDLGKAPNKPVFRPFSQESRCLPRLKSDGRDPVTI